jgi:hypothetical protein
MTQGDMVVFYAELRSLDPNATKPISAIVGLFLVDEIVAAADVPPNRYDENAHKRSSDLRTLSGTFRLDFPSGMVVPCGSTPIFQLRRSVAKLRVGTMFPECCSDC